jgi:hypothetical protein
MQPYNLHADREQLACMLMIDLVLLGLDRTGHHAVHLVLVSLLDRVLGPGPLTTHGTCMHPGADLAS